MASAKPPQNHNQNRRQWRFTWETLAHLPVLRLYIFQPDISIFSFSHLGAELRLDDSLLLVSLSHGGGDAVVLRVPVPRVLVDPAAPVECRDAGDHVEVRLSLVIPVDHPIVAAVFPPAAGTEPPAPLTLNDDLKGLSSGDVHLYCKTCSTRLTKQPLRHIAEMPSFNWLDVADNWFGSCCCSFGGASEKLISQYINSYELLRGTSLLDATSISIEKDFLEDCAFEKRDLICNRDDSMPSNGFFAVQDDAISGIKTREVHTNKNVDLNYLEKVATDHKNDIYPTKVLSPVLPAEVSCITCIEENKEPGRLAQPCLVQLENDNDLDSLKSCIDCCVENTKKPLNDSEDKFSVDPCHCCFDNRVDNEETGDNLSSTSSKGQKNEHMLEMERDPNLVNTYLSGSFIVKASNLFNDIEWVELLCDHCSSPLGSHPSRRSHAPVDGRIRLFKCYISTDLPVDGLHDVFRRHTLQRIFVNLLLEIAEDEISFRTVVRDLKTKSPMLQIVLLSSKVWLFSGYCYENDVNGSHGAADLRPAVKLLFSDCSNVTEAELRTLEEWSTKYRAEDMYMMRRQTQELIECLNSSMDKLPLSCSSLQGMYLSSLDR